MKHKLLILLSFLFLSSCALMTKTEVPRMSEMNCMESCDTFYKSYLDYDDQKGCYCGKK